MMPLLLATALAADCAPLPELRDFEIDPTVVDELPPPVADVDAPAIELDPGSIGCSACAPRLSVGLTMLPEDDDTTPAEDLGYVFRLAEGELPPGITLPEGPVLGPEITLAWDLDPDEIRGQAIFVVVEVRTVDLAGNESLGVLNLTIEDEAPDGVASGGGCRHGGGPFWLLLPLLWATRFRPSGRAAHPPARA